MDQVFLLDALRHGDREVEDGLVQLAVGVELEGSGLEATTSEDDGVRLDVLAGAGSADMHGDDLAVDDLAAGDLGAEHVIDALVLGGHDELVVETHAWHAGRQGRDLEHLGSEDLAEISKNLGVAVDTEDGRQGDDLTGVDESLEALGQHPTGTSVVEGARHVQAGGVILTLAGLEVDDDGAGGGVATAGQLGAIDVLGDEACVEVLVLGQTDDDDLVAVLEVAVDHRRRDQGGGTDRANSGRQIDRRLGVADQEGLTDDLTQEVDALLDSFHADLGVGVLGMLGGVLPDGLVRLLDALRGVTKDVDGALAQLQAADTLGDEGHTGATTAKTQGGGQAGQARSDNDDVRRLEAVGGRR